MKTRFCSFCLPALMAALLLPAFTFAQSGDNDGCTNATLNGDYGFKVSGQIFPPGSLTFPPTAVPVQRDGVAMTHFNGQGGLTQVDFLMSNGSPTPGPSDPLTGFHTGETGWYKVFPDCTGMAEIRFPTPPGGTSGAVIDLMFVLSNHGNTIHTIVSRLVPPNSSNPVPASIHSDAEKLGSVTQED
jgi:hypothetical protein